MLIFFFSEQPCELPAAVSAPFLAVLAVAAFLSVLQCIVSVHLPLCEVCCFSWKRECVLFRLCKKTLHFCFVFFPSVVRLRCFCGVCSLVVIKTSASVYVCVTSDVSVLFLQCVL